MPKTPVPAAATGLPIPRHVREAISAEIERLIYLLDLVDGDADLEDGADRELDEAEAGIGDREGLWEQGFAPGRGLELLQEEAQAANQASVRLGAIVARLSGMMVAQ